VADKVQDIMDMMELARSLTTGIPALRREISKAIREAVDLGQQSATFRSISREDIVDAFAQIARDMIPVIAPTLAQTHGARISQALLSRNQPLSKRDTLVIYAPTPSGRFRLDDKLIRVPGVRIADMNVEIALGGGGGRLFGFGLARSKQLREAPNESYMLLRVDWHDTRIQHGLPYAQYFTTSSGFQLHWQIPETPAEAKSHRSS
jgi:hypothetical protein